MKKLVFATNNPHKLEEIRHLAGESFQILSLKEIGCHDEIPEDADTLEGNASAKAWYVFDRFGLDCFADDTGLEIKALNGRPGVRSARYAGLEGDARKNTRKVLAELKGVAERESRFRTVISLILNGEEHLFEGVVEGTILESERGTEGFGYDPVF